MRADHAYRAIVIGVSAGGLYALTILLSKLPRRFPLPIIIVQHRAKEEKELLEEILRQKCDIPIKQADEKEVICEGMVYIAPPDYHLLVEQDMTFSLSADEPVRYSRPSIDILFETAAEVYKDKLIGIILTGANDDGAAGIKTIFSYGGLTIAQDPKDAEYPFMPNAAVETGAVQYILPLPKIVKFLTGISNHGQITTP